MITTKEMSPSQVKALREEYDGKTYGAWNVYAPAYGGYSEELLGTFEGRWEDVVEHAIGMDKFWMSGQSGRLLRTDFPVRVQPGWPSCRAKLVDKALKLTEELEEIETLLRYGDAGEPLQSLADRIANVIGEYPDAPPLM